MCTNCGDVVKREYYQRYGHLDKPELVEPWLNEEPLSARYMAAVEAWLEDIQGIDVTVDYAGVSSAHLFEIHKAEFGEWYLAEVTRRYDEYNNALYRADMRRDATCDRNAMF